MKVINCPKYITIVKYYETFTINTLIYKNIMQNQLNFNVEKQIKTKNIRITGLIINIYVFSIKMRLCIKYVKITIAIHVRILYINIINSSYSTKFSLQDYDTSMIKK